ncbi:MAG: WD40 repeat domain-containing protein, partial [Oscillochloris sp.]|nr:WD40 repeat domain-containing protein [Oscillochloris sp.]
LLALRAAQSTHSGDTAIPEVDQILQQATQESRLRRTLTIAETVGTSVAYGPTDQVAAGTRDGRVLRWASADLPPEQISGPTGGESQVAYSRDGQWLVTGSADGVIRIWDTATGAQIRASPVITQTGLKSIAVNRDNSLVAVSFDQTDHVYLLDSLSLEQRLPPLVPGRLSRAVAFSPSEDLLASGSEDYVVRLWDSRSGALQAELRVDHSNSSAARILALAFTPDGKTLAVAGMEPDAFVIYIWDVASRSKIHTLTGHTDTILTLAFAPDGAFLASSGFDSMLILWDVLSGREITRLRGSAAVVSGLAFSPDGGKLLSSSRDSRLAFWDMRLIHGQGVFCSALSQDARLIATAGMGGTIKLWDAATGILAQSLPTADGVIVSVSISPNSHYLAAAHTNGTAYLWDLSDPAMTAFPIPATCPGGCNAVAFSPDSTTLALGGYNATIHLWGLEARRLLLALTIPEQLALPNAPLQVNGLSFSPDGSLLAIAAANNGLFVWDAATRELWPKFNFAGVARTVAFSSQGHLAVAGIGAAPVVYDMAAGTSRSLPNSAASVWRIAFSPDGALLATANDDGTIRTWDAASGTFQQFFSGINQPNDLAFRPDGAQLVVSDAQGFARMVLLNMRQLYDLAASHLSRDLSQAECDTFHIDPCSWQAAGL